MHHFCRGVSQRFHGELYRTLHAVKVVVQALPGKHHHGRRHTQQGQLGAQILLKHIFHGLDGLFGLLGTAQQIPVILWNV